MKEIRFSKIHVFTLALLLLFFSQCSTKIDPVTIPLADDSYSISQEEAEAIFTGLDVANEKPPKLDQKNRIASDSRITEIQSFQSLEKVDLFFILNFLDGGFVILSADKRTRPVLAYSKYNNFPLLSDNKEYPQGISYWLKETKNYIQMVKEGKIKSKYYEKEWEAERIFQIIGKGGFDPIIKLNLRSDPAEDCEDWSIVKNPFMSTTWGQGDGYNNSLTSASCSNYTECNHRTNGKPWTGCIATAMAQIMKYYQHPSSYSWSSMPNNSPNTYIADLMKDIGSSVSGYNYGCTVTLGNSNNAKNAFMSSFSYSNASYQTNMNSTTATNNLDINRPIMIGGYDSHGNNGHTWVSDGYQKFFYCDPGVTYLYFNMIWGWDCSDYNGYYGIGGYTPGPPGYEENYSYGCDLIYNIIP